MLHTDHGPMDDLGFFVSQEAFCCVGTIELPYLDEQRASETSPEATGPKSEPPIPYVPGLNKALAWQACKGLGTGVVKLFRHGTRQKMPWYDLFRYEQGKEPASDWDGYTCPMQRS